MYNKRKRWGRLGRLIKNVMIPFAEAALLITMAAKPVTGTPRRRDISFFSVYKELGREWREGRRLYVHKGMAV